MIEGTRIEFYDRWDTSNMYALRRWPHVPRVGDTVELRRGDEKYALAEVTHVRWGQIGEVEQCAVVFFTWRRRPRDKQAKPSGEVQP